MQQIQRRAIYIFILGIALVWIFISADHKGASTAGKIPAPQAGFLAPEFSLTALDGKTITLSEMRGQAILVNLWTTWCPPCKTEMPTLQKMYEEYHNQGFVILALNMTYQDTRSEVAPFAKEYGLTFPILLDLDGQVAAQYQLHSLPSSFFIDREGIIQEVVIGGPMSEALLRTRIESILQ